MEPSACIGQTFTGTVKSYSGHKGYGFILAEGLSDNVFFIHKSLPKDVMYRTKDGSDFKLQDKELTFTIDTTAEGRPIAVDMQPHFEIPPPGPKSHMVMFGAMRAKGKGKWGGWAPWDWDWHGGKGERKGKGKGKGKKSDAPHRPKPDAPGTPLLDVRVTATMKSYSNDSNWGFATVDSSVGEFGDVFVHSRNLDEALVATNTNLRTGDVIECDLEEVGGRPVARNVTLVPQDPALFAGHWMKGIVASYSEDVGVGSISCPRVWGDISFVKDDLAPCMHEGCIDFEVIFQLNIDGMECKAQHVNPMDGMSEDEAQERTEMAVDTIAEEGHIDEVAVTALKQCGYMEVLVLLPELDYHKAENSSSYILGALSRHRKIAQSWKGWGKGWCPY